MRKMINGIYWFFRPEELRGRKYLREIDYVSENTEYNLMVPAMMQGVIREDRDQCHDAMAEIVEYAHEKGIGIALHISAIKGFLNPSMDPNVDPVEGTREVYTIDDVSRAQALAQEYEMTADGNGYACLRHEACGMRSKLRPLCCRLIRVYAFDKAGDGFYVPGTLEDVTAKTRIIECRTHALEADVCLGPAYAGKTVYALVAQYGNWYELFGGRDWPARKALMDMYADIPFDGVCMDEYGYMLLNVDGVRRGELPPFRSRFYGEGQKEHYRKKFGLDLDRELFDMRYAPLGSDGVRIRAVNRYYEELRVPVLEEERRVADYARKLFGENVYLGVHNTFHNCLSEDEVWHTTCAWWDLPRQHGHTDETLTFPARMGILLSEPDPLMLHMYYYPDYLREMVRIAPFNARIFHHALNDTYWGKNHSDPEFAAQVRVLDRKIAMLNDFQSAPPRLDLLILFGESALFNWYPDADARNLWDIDGSLEIEPICDTIWDAGYRAALVPDHAVTDGRVRLTETGFSFNGHPFTHCLFLYPKYAKKAVYGFLNEAHRRGLPVAAVGRGEIDFDAEPAHLDFDTNPVFSPDILEEMGCPKSAVPEGCLCSNGGFVLANYEGLVNGAPTEFDFSADGVRYSGVSTGILAYREGEAPVSTPGGRLRIDGREIPLP